jgi:cell pole-organizing protein PopZ
MTPRSDHDEDMSMDEILASIRRFVTDNPHEDSLKQEAPRRNSSEPIAVRPIRQDMENRQQGEGQRSGHPHARAHVQPQTQRPQVRNPYSVKNYGGGDSSSQLVESDILELTNPLPPASARMNPEMILEDPIALGIKNVAVQSEPALSDSSTTSYAVTASANSMARLAQTAKSAQHKQTGLKFSQPHNITIEQLIRDMVRPFIKEWVEANLHILVEEMVAKEIKRITQHLE